MPGPLPANIPIFPDAFVLQAESAVRRRSIPLQAVQRFRLVLLLHREPYLGSETAAREVGLCGRQVRHWRQRWASGDYSIEDLPGRGRKPVFSPLRRSTGEGPRL